MFSIGEFARHGRVSVRMLRHYDALGLLRPAHVDPCSGYRSYEAGQLARLNRIIALKGLGFTLHAVGRILDERVGDEELRGMLRLRRAELAAEQAAARARLVDVEARLRTIEREGVMPVEDIVVKPLAAVRVAELTAVAASYGPQDIGPVAGPLFEQLFQDLCAAGVRGEAPGIAWYEDAPEGGGAVTVHAACPLPAGTSEVAGLRVVDLPAVEEAATIIHRGSMDDILPTAQALARWIDGAGRRSAGYARELYLECPEDRAKWVTELQEPLRS